MAERSAKQLGLTKADLPNSIIEVIATLDKNGFDAYIVGGGVRDNLLGLHPKDFDAVTNAKPFEIKDLFGKRCRIIGRRFQLAHVYSGRDMIEVATFRAPPNGDAHTTSDGMIVRDNVWGDIEQDFARRDFSINALYYQPIKGVVHDFCNALDDIKSKTLRLLGHAPVRIEEDPVRLLRALRFKAKLGFEFDTELAEQFNDKNWSLLEQVSPHRLYDESQKMFTGGYLVPLLPLLFEYGAIKHLIVYPPKSPTALVNQVAINTDKRIAIGKSINPAFFYAALLWDNYLYQLNKFKNKGMPFYDAQMQAASKVIERQRIKTAIPRFAEQFIRDIWVMQPKLANPRAKQIVQLAEHPRFRAAFDFLLLREQCDDESNPLSESTNGMGEWWQTYQTLSEKQKMQAIADFGSEGRGTSKRSRNRTRNRNKALEENGTLADTKANEKTQALPAKQRSSASAHNQTSTHKSDDTLQDDSLNMANNPRQKPSSIVSSQRQDTIPAKRSRRSQPSDESSKNASVKAVSGKAKVARGRGARGDDEPNYAREREQLQKLSLGELAGDTGKHAHQQDSQPKPLFTIDADKMAKQLPQQVALNQRSNQVTKTPASNSKSNAKQADAEPIKQTSDATASTLAKTPRALQTAGNAVLLPKAEPLPHKRRRRAPSSDVTQAEKLLSQGSEAVQGSQSDEPLPSDEQANTGKPNKADDQKVTSKEAKPKTRSKRSTSHSDTNKNGTDKNGTTRAEKVDNTDKPDELMAKLAKTERVPATRRRRKPSSDKTVAERQTANG